MKISNACKSFLSILMLCLLVLSMFSSCRRNKKCDLIVTVTDGVNGGPVAGASVHVHPNRTNANGNLKEQDQTGTTDGSGIARFTFKLPAQLEADVTSNTSSGVVTKMVQLEEGKSVALAVKVY